MQEEDLLEIVDERDRVVGVAPRRLCHGDPSLVHRVAHVLVVNSRGEILLQKRSPHKDIQPGKWDTSVGGHLDPGEGYEEAARRELREELGIADAELTFLYAYPLRNAVESENVRTYLCRHDGPVHPDPAEITEARFWSRAEIMAEVGTGVFTPNFEEEFARFRDLDPGP